MSDEKREKKTSPNERPAKSADTGGRKRSEKERADERLDEGVEESFPASDPVSVRITK